MKALILLTAAFSAAPAFASQIGCETSIRIAVNRTLEEENRGNEEVQSVVRVSAANDFSSFDVYRVHAVNTGMLPSNSDWLVVAKRGPMATCQAVSILLDREVQ